MLTIIRRNGKLAIAEFTEPELPKPKTNPRNCPYCGTLNLPDWSECCRCGAPNRAKPEDTEDNNEYEPCLEAERIIHY